MNIQTMLYIFISFVIYVEVGNKYIIIQIYSHMFNNYSEWNCMNGRNKSSIPNMPAKGYKEPINGTMTLQRTIFLTSY